jgi:uncharacterized protein (DUF2252 family)
MVRTMQWIRQSMSPGERRKLGQARRRQARRQQHDELHPGKRPASAVELIARSMQGRVPALINLKYELMLGSPFAYFRGAAPVMAADLAALANTGIECQICGDAHVRNLGAYAAPDGRLVFDINDFDETIRAPFEWDLKRMAASLVLAGRAAGHKESSARAAAQACVARYAMQMREFAGMPLLEIARFLVHRMDVAKPVHEAFMKAERATPQHTLEQLTEPAKRGEAKAAASRPFRKTRGKDGAKKSVASGGASRNFKENPPMLTRENRTRAAAILAALTPYAEMLEPQRRHLLGFYRPVDVAFKVVGTGSVGLRDYCVYFEGNGEGDPLFLQIKEETHSAYAPYLGESHGHAHDGQRVVQGQRAMQTQSDPFLGWTRIGSRQFLVRQLNDHKGSIELGDLAGDNLRAYAEVCGELLARGHARSGDALVIAGYLGSGDGCAEALAKFGARYADQTEKDWEELKKARKGKSAK